MSSNIELWEDLLAWLESFENGSAANVKLVETPGELNAFILPIIAISTYLLLYTAGRGLVARADLPVRPNASSQQSFRFVAEYSFCSLAFYNID